MSRHRRTVSLVLFGSILASLGGGCAQDPGANTRCVFESSTVATGACLTQCESQCSLEQTAGCGFATCVLECDGMAYHETEACLDASYAHWRCLRLAGLPLVECSSGKATLVVPDGACLAERKHELAACVTVDAGSAGSGGEGGG